MYNKNLKKFHHPFNWIKFSLIIFIIAILCSALYAIYWVLTNYWNMNIVSILTHPLAILVYIVGAILITTVIHFKNDDSILNGDDDDDE
jgi:fatty acid desaturase